MDWRGMQSNACSRWVCVVVAYYGYCIDKNVQGGQGECRLDKGEHYLF